MMTTITPTDIRNQQRAKDIQNDIANAVEAQNWSKVDALFAECKDLHDKKYMNAAEYNSLTDLELWKEMML